MISFDMYDPDMKVMTIFGFVEDCRYALATYAYRRGFEFITETLTKRMLGVHCRQTKCCKWQLHASAMKYVHPIDVIPYI